jgi:putative IMPACT (imprinted ancient) family translation regulator
VRAYGGAAREALRAAPKSVLKAKVQLQLDLPYASLGVAYATIDRCHAQRMGDEEYLDDGRVRVVVALDVDAEADFVARVQDATAGGVMPRLVVAKGTASTERSTT